MSELFLELRTDSVEEAIAIESFTLEQRRGGEEGSEERRSLHPVAQVGIGCLFGRDLECVEREDLDVFLPDRVTCLEGEALPELGRLLVALNDEHTTVGESRQRIGVTEDVRVWRQHHVDITQLAVEPDRIVSESRVERGRLALFLRSVFRVCLDVEPEQIERCEGEILAHRDRTPSTDGVNPEREGAFGHQVEITGALERELGELRVGIEELLLPDLELRKSRVPADEVDAEIELTALLSVGKHVLDGGDDVARLQITASESEAPGVEVGDLLRDQSADRRVREWLAVAAVVLLRETESRLLLIGEPDPAILDGLRHRCADLPEQREIDGQRLVGSLEDDDALSPRQHGGDEVGREGTEHREIEDADLEPALLAQVIDDRLGVVDDRALTCDDPLGVVQPVSHRPCVMPTRQLLELSHRLIGESWQMIEVEGSLRGDSLRVAVLVLDDTEHRRIVDVEHLRNAAARVAEDELLRRRRRLDHVGRISEILPDEVALGETD